MRNAAIISVLFHAGVFALAYFGLPGLKPLPILTETPIIIEVVEVSDETRAPPRQRQPEAKKPAPKVEAKPEPKPEPPKQAEAPPPPPAPPEPEPEPEVVAVPPPPSPKPLAKKKPEPEDKPKPVAKPKPSPVLARVQPKRKPKPVDAFESVFKTVRTLKDQPRPQSTDTAKKAPEKKPDDFQARIAKALVSRSATKDVAEKITISEIDLVRQQIMRCWNVQGGYKGVENLSVQIKVSMNPDGTVRDARIDNANAYGADPFKKAFAESAYRAVLNKRCQPFKLPPEKYGEWKTMTLNFDPRDML